jgi:prepilin-type N-terminal cleavage/methylation domain-containing protein
VSSRERRDDAGFSLTEVVVAMGILSVVMVTVLGATMQIYSAVNRTENTSFAREQLGNAFRRLDKELRYATWVSTPGQVGGRWYLEYATTAGCHQLMMAGGVLTVASWTLPGTNPGPAATIAGELGLPAGTVPFTVYAPGTKPYASASPGTAGMGRDYATEHTQVRLRFTATVGKVTLPFDTVFTAQNTDRNTPTLNGCSDGRPET